MKSVGEADRENAQVEALTKASPSHSVLRRFHGGIRNRSRSARF